MYGVSTNLSRMEMHLNNVTLQVPAPDAIDKYNTFNFNRVTWIVMNSHTHGKSSSAFQRLTLHKHRRWFLSIHHNWMLLHLLFYFKSTFIQKYCNHSASQITKYKINATNERLERPNISNNASETRNPGSVLSNFTHLQRRPRRHKCTIAPSFRSVSIKYHTKQT